MANPEMDNYIPPVEKMNMNLQARIATLELEAQSSSEAMAILTAERDALRAEAGRMRAALEVIGTADEHHDDKGLPFRTCSRCGMLVDSPPDPQCTPDECDGALARAALALAPAPPKPEPAKEALVNTSEPLYGPQLSDYIAALRLAEEALDKCSEWLKWLTDCHKVNAEGFSQTGAVDPHPDQWRGILDAAKDARAALAALRALRTGGGR